MKQVYQRIKSVIGLSLPLAKAGFKLKNEGSYLGVFWYLLNPLLTFILLFLIFSGRVDEEIKNYPAYLLLGIIVFNFFQNSTIESTKIIRENKWVIKSIKFPTESLVLSVVLKNLYSHIFEVFLFSILLFYFNTVSLWAFLYFLIIILLLIFIFGVCLLLASLSVYFVDLDNVWAFLIKIIWFATPIFYSIGEQTKLFYFNLFNPMYYFITAVRDVVVYRNISEPWIISGIIGWSFFSLVIGLLVFNKIKIKFAEII